MQILNERCKHCNAVSSHDIETNVGDYSDKSFFRDYDGFYLCHACKEAHEELMADYEKEHDDVWGWYTLTKADNDNNTLETEVPEEDTD